jgi:serine/threonine-protein kinase
VIKQICPKLGDSEAETLQAYQKACTLFQQEAKTQHILGNHSRIPTLLSAFDLGGEFYLVQEFIRGKTLQEEVKLTGSWQETVVKRFLHELLPVLEYIHCQQVIHRDIKPANIIRRERTDQLVLIDFGAAAAFQHGSQGDQSFAGTLGYAPPEQCEHQPVFASDIYALGCTCLYLLSGKSPIEMEWDYTTCQILWQKYVQVSPFLDRILDKMLRVNLGDRYHTAPEVLQDLHTEPEPVVSKGYESPNQRLAAKIRARLARSNLSNA